MGRAYIRVFLTTNSEIFPHGKFALRLLIPFKKIPPSIIDPPPPPLVPAFPSKKVKIHHVQNV